MLKARNLTKSFTSYNKKEGSFAALSSFFKRNYVTKQAVENFDLDIHSGEIIGLLGPNGAGKTTLMKMFTGIIVPTSGELTVFGHIPSKRHKKYRQQIALVMGQKSQLWWDIPALDSFKLLQKYYEIDEVSFRTKLGLMSEMLSVQKLMHVQVRKLSLGERMKLELMASLLHSPNIIFLDEPTIGLDLISQENIRKFILEYHKENNCSIVLTSHYMEDVQALCPRLVLIINGQKGFDGQIKEFETILGNEKTVKFHFSSSQIKDKFEFNNFSPEWNADLTEVELKIPKNDLKLISAKVLTNYDVVDFQTEKLPIEKVMKEILKRPELLYKNDH